MSEILRPGIIRKTFAVIAGSVMLFGCSDKDKSKAEYKRKLRASIEVAHEAGFENAFGYDKKDPKKVAIQFGACILPAEVTVDNALALDPSVDQNIKYNPGAVDNEVSKILYNSLREITSVKLGTLTHYGLTGLSNCEKTAEEMMPLLEQIEKGKLTH